MTLEEILTKWVPELNPQQKKRLIIELRNYMERGLMFPPLQIPVKSWERVYKIPVRVL